MTNEQIEHIVRDTIGYPLNEWVNAEGISFIGMAQDINLFIDYTRMLIKFNMTESLLEIVYGSYVNSEFIAENGEATDYTGSSFIVFSEIASIITSTYKGANGTYHQRFFEGKAKISSSSIYI
jgi:hypothetical protein